MRKIRLHYLKGHYSDIVFAPDLKSALGKHVDFGFFIFGSKFKNKVLNFIEGKKE